MVSSGAGRWVVLALLAAAVVIAAGYMISMREQEGRVRGTLVQNMESYERNSLSEA